MTVHAQYSSEADQRGAARSSHEANCESHARACSQRRPNLQSRKEKLTVTSCGPSVTLMGDSSGGGISLAPAQRLREDGYDQPGHVVLLSPWLDATLSNPEIAEFDKIDPFLGVEGLKYGGEVYARDVDPKSYLVSPVYGSLKNLAPITLFIGTRDILYPDCRKLRDNAAAEGVAINYREYPGMVHNWMLGPMPEAKHAIAEIIAAIK